MKNEVCLKYNVDPNYIGVWSSGVSTTLFKAENYLDNEIRKKFKLENKFIIFYHGVFRKGVIDTLKAIEILKNSNPNIVLFLLGRETYKLDLNKTIREAGIENMVIKHNSVPYYDVPKYIAMCDVGIIPLRNVPDWRYQCPLKLLEYLAMEKVVIATDIMANRLVLGNCKCGVYVSSTNPIDISNAVLYLYKNKEVTISASIGGGNN